MSPQPRNGAPAMKRVNEFEFPSIGETNRMPTPQPRTPSTEADMTTAYMVGYERGKDEAEAALRARLAAEVGNMKGWPVTADDEHYDEAHGAQYGDLLARAAVLRVIKGEPQP